MQWHRGSKRKYLFSNGDRCDQSCPMNQRLVSCATTTISPSSKSKVSAAAATRNPGRWMPGHDDVAANRSIRPYLSSHAATNRLRYLLSAHAGAMFDRFPRISHSGLPGNLVERYGGGCQQIFSYFHKAAYVILNYHPWTHPLAERSTDHQSQPRVIMPGHPITL